MTYGETSPGLKTVTLPPVIGKISEPASSFAVPTTPGWLERGEGVGEALVELDRGGLAGQRVDDGDGLGRAGRLRRRRGARSAEASLLLLQAESGSATRAVTARPAMVLRFMVRMVAPNCEGFPCVSPGVRSPRDGLDPGAILGTADGRRGAARRSGRVAWRGAAVSSRRRRRAGRPRPRCARPAAPRRAGSGAVGQDHDGHGDGARAHPERRVHADVLAELARGVRRDGAAGEAHEASTPPRRPGARPGRRPSRPR